MRQCIGCKYLVKRGYYRPVCRALDKKFVLTSNPYTGGLEWVTEAGSKYNIRPFLEEIRGIGGKCGPDAVLYEKNVSMLGKIISWVKDL